MQTRKVGSSALRFPNFQELVGVDVFENLLHAGGPVNLYGGLFGRTQAEVKTFVVGAHVAASGGRKPSLAVHGNARAISITIAASSAE
jgi:hypothetical protein